MRKIKKGDEVIVIAGKDKGRRGAVLAVTAGGQQLLVEGVNLLSKTIKANPNNGEEGGIRTKLMPIFSSKVMLYNAETNKGSRVGIRLTDDGRKVRYFKSTGKEV